MTRQASTRRSRDSRRSTLAGLAAIALSLATPLAMAQDYPSHPVKIIVPFAAGGPADVYARVLAQKLQESLGQTFVIDNRPGGGSLIGTARTNLSKKKG